MSVSYNHEQLIQIVVMNPPVIEAEFPHAEPTKTFEQFKALVRSALVHELGVRFVITERETPLEMFGIAKRGHWSRDDYEEPSGYDAKAKCKKVGRNSKGKHKSKDKGKNIQNK